MRRAALGFSALLMALALPAPAMADDNPCKGQAPGPHCRPMDCEIVWDDSVVIEPDVVPFPGIPSYRCYT